MDAKILQKTYNSPTGPKYMDVCFGKIMEKYSKIVGCSSESAINRSVQIFTTIKPKVTYMYTELPGKGGDIYS